MNFHDDKTMHFQSLTLNVKDLEKLTQFYRDVLGFTLVQEDEKSSVLEVGDSGHRLYLEKLEDGIRDSMNHSGLFHVAYLVPTVKDLGVMIKHLHENRIAVGGGDHLVSQAIYFSDPEGNGIEIYADRPHETWSWTDDLVAMDTLPLDIESILEASGEAKFDGFPNEGKIGHIHLRTHDLDESMKFWSDLNFEKVTNYPGAHFLADNKYHHHIAVNRWHARVKRDENAHVYGLKQLELYVPNTAESETLETPEGVLLAIV